MPCMHAVGCKEPYHSTIMHGCLYQPTRPPTMMAVTINQLGSFYMHAKHPKLSSNSSHPIDDSNFLAIGMHGNTKLIIKQKRTYMYFPPLTHSCMGTHQWSRYLLHNCIRCSCCVVINRDPQCQIGGWGDRPWWYINKNYLQRSYKII